QANFEDARLLSSLHKKNGVDGEPSFRPTDQGKPPLRQTGLNQFREVLNPGNSNTAKPFVNEALLRRVEFQRN
ncbi:MAG: hypothetical protein VYA08_09455, partial [Pseudomonadota bacterium]|nr:hypothetical protein [Pseudomonadota bacterium]